MSWIYNRFTRGKYRLVRLHSYLELCYPKWYPCHVKNLFCWLALLGESSAVKTNWLHLCSITPACWKAGCWSHCHLNLAQLFAGAGFQDLDQISTSENTDQLISGLWQPFFNLDIFEPSKKMYFVDWDRFPDIWTLFLAVGCSRRAPALLLCLPFLFLSLLMCTNGG